MLEGERERERVDSGAEMLVNRRSIKLAYSLFVIWKQPFLLSAGSRKPFNLLMCNCAASWFWGARVVIVVVVVHIPYPVAGTVSTAS